LREYISLGIIERTDGSCRNLGGTAQRVGCKTPGIVAEAVRRLAAAALPPEQVVAGEGRLIGARADPHRLTAVQQGLVQTVLPVQDRRHGQMAPGEIGGRLQHVPAEVFAFAKPASGQVLFDEVDSFGKSHQEISWNWRHAKGWRA
jgi:hypothetical protein